MKECRVTSCRKATTRWGRLCTTHRNHQRRHGHPEQTGVTKGELAPYRKIVRDRKARNPDNPFWSAVEARWLAVVDTARRVVDRYQDGEPMPQTHRKACEELIRVAEDVAPWIVSETALAMVILQNDKPRRFKSDDAFRQQFARRVRGLTDLNAGSWYDHGTGKVKRVYRDISAKTAIEIGQTLVEVFGYPGLLLARHEEQATQRKRQERMELASMVEALQ